MELELPARKKARIEIIPLIDVVFFLCATFVLFTLSLSKIGGMELKLPKSGPAGDDSTTVFIQASEAGTAYWKQGARSTSELISMVELPARLAEYKKHVAAPRVFILGDNKAKFGAAAAILDEVRAAGIKEVSIQTMTTRTGM